MEIATLYEVYKQYPLVTTDTRKDLTGSIFFCLKGPNFDANGFAKEALKKGAAWVVADDFSLLGEEKITVVRDSLIALQSLATFHRRKFKFPVIGITGSNGKTTNKELIHSALSTKYLTFATKGNLNNHIGVPLTLLEIPLNAEMAVIEMGANHQGEIRDLSAICQPDFGIITNIGLAHLEGFGGPEGVKKGKKELYDHISIRGGKVIVNADDPVLMEISEGLDRITFGNSTKALIKGNILNSKPFISFTYTEGDFTSPQIYTQLVGDYNLPNLLTAVCAGRIFGVEHQSIKSALESYAPSNQRSQLVKTIHNTIILDAYNANPSSMQVALNNFASMDGYKIAMVGHMLELGDSSQTQHQLLIDQIKTLNLEAYLVGINFKSCDVKGLKWFANSDELSAFISENPVKNKTILLKGSRMAAMEKLEKVL